MGSLLKINNLEVSASNKKILKGVNLTIEKGQTHLIMGPNGSGKSTLARAIINDPQYTLDSGSIIFDSEDITDLSCDKRALAGIFLSFQAPVEIPGITLWSFLRDIQESHKELKMSSRKFRKHVEALCEEIELDPSFLDREFNVGFSGGEKKKVEMLQLLLIKPKLAILDEADSGLDVDAQKAVSMAISLYTKKMDGTLLIITHNTKILESVDVDEVHVLKDGQVVYTNGTDIIDDINDHGFNQFMQQG